MSDQPTTALLLSWMERSIAIAPTSEPIAPNKLWTTTVSGIRVAAFSVGIPPIITSQPASVAVTEGLTATFSITATGYTSIQWQKQESGTGAWADISGATSSSYATGILAAATDSTDKYRCVLLGLGGTTTSDAATLTVYYETLLDNTNLGSALAAYGPFRKMRAAYSGAAIRVRRSVDNAEQDIGFTINVLDTASLLTFSLGSNAFVTTVYDQSGTGLHIVQTDTTKQPQIVSLGALILHSFKASLTHDTTDLMQTATNIASGLSGLTGVIAFSGGGSADKPSLKTGTNAATQSSAIFALDSGAGLGKHRCGMTGGSGTYDLWDNGTGDTTRLTRGAILDRTLSSALEVLPIRGAVIATTGYSQTFSNNMVSTFDQQPIVIGDVGNVMRWDSAVIYPRALSAADAALMLEIIGANSEGVSIGDSTIAAYLGTTAVGQYIYTNSERCSRRGIHELANPGDTIAQQKTAWTAYPHKTSAKWVCVQIGLNDTNPATATATTIAALQDLVTTIRSGTSASCKICIATMDPCYNRFAAVGYDPALALAKWRAMNDAVMGRGSSPITGVDARTEDHTTALTTLISGNETLSATYDTGDGIHPNNAGRQIVAAAWRAMLTGLGLI